MGFGWAFGREFLIGIPRGIQIGRFWSIGGVRMFAGSWGSMDHDLMTLENFLVALGSYVFLMSDMTLRYSSCKSRCLLAHAIEYVPSQI